eukprot:m.74987 g.74987  ORF g.74987 m.74987 type:complete len:92 (-) comp14390_c0_seq1:1331-1606(-)
MVLLKAAGSIVLWLVVVVKGCEVDWVIVVLVSVLVVLVVLGPVLEGDEDDAVETDAFGVDIVGFALVECDDSVEAELQGNEEVAFLVVTFV